MTDNKIIKALECCMYDDYDYCKECLYRKNKPCQENLIRDALNLINRQKAEIERQREYIELLDIEHEAIKISAIKKFIKRFEKKIKDVKFTIGQTWEIQSALKEVEKEMVGDKNDKS